MLCLKEKDKTKLTAGFLAEAPGRPFTELKSTGGHQGVQSWTHWNQKWSSETDSGSMGPDSRRQLLAGAWNLEIVTYRVSEATGVCQGRECRKARQEAAHA